ncbi:MAG: hypothetical protein P4L16_00480 [Chlamydiales bacterium]|nr:hypothetical protein [Chlamydiales bacterium]
MSMKINEASTSLLQFFPVDLVPNEVSLETIDETRDKIIEFFKEFDKAFERACQRLYPPVKDLFVAREEWKREQKMCCDLGFPGRSEEEALPRGIKIKQNVIKQAILELPLEINRQAFGAKTEKAWNKVFSLMVSMDILGRDKRNERLQELEKCAKEDEKLLVSAWRKQGEEKRIALAARYTR